MHLPLKKYNLLINIVQWLYNNDKTVAIKFTCFIRTCHLNDITKRLKGTVSEICSIFDRVIVIVMFRFKFYVIDEVVCKSSN